MPMEITSHLLIRQVNSCGSNHGLMMKIFPNDALFHAQ